MTIGDEVVLINEGSTFTDAGSLVRFGEKGYVVGFRGWANAIVVWSDRTYSEVPLSDLTVRQRLPTRKRDLG